MKRVGSLECVCHRRRQAGPVIDRWIVGISVPGVTVVPGEGQGYPALDSEGLVHLRRPRILDRLAGSAARVRVIVDDAGQVGGWIVTCHASPDGADLTRRDHVTRED